MKFPTIANCYGDTDLLRARTTLYNDLAFRQQTLRDLKRTIQHAEQDLRFQTDICYYSDLVTAYGMSTSIAREASIIVEHLQSLQTIFAQEK